MITMLNIFNSTRFTATVLTGCLLLASPAFAADETESSGASIDSTIIEQPAADASPAIPQPVDSTETVVDVQADAESSAATEQDSSAETAVPEEQTSVDVAEPMTKANAINSDTISAFRFEGNELLDSVSIEQQLRGFAGLKINSTNLFKAKLAVKKIYSKSGLPGVAVSNARAEADGTVIITIVEDKIKTAQPVQTDTVNVESTVSGMSETATETVLQTTEPAGQIAPDIEAAGQNSSAEMSPATETREPVQTAISERASKPEPVDTASQPALTDSDQNDIPQAEPETAIKDQDTEPAAREQSSETDTTISAQKTEVQASEPSTMVNVAETGPAALPEARTEIKQGHTEATDATVKKAEQDPVPGLKPLPAPAAWLVDGWKQLESGNADQAMATWQQEVNKMHGYRYLSFIGVYKSQNTAIRILKKAGLEHHALMLIAERGGKPAYYVLSALQTSYDKEQRQLELTSLRKKMGIDYIYASAAKRFQGQTIAMQTPASKAVEKAEPVEARVETIPTPVSKPVAKKQIVKKDARKAVVKKPVSQAPAKEVEAEVIEEVKTSDGKITGFEIYGNSLISDKAIQRKLQPYLGDNKTASDLLQARNKITRLYQGRGYPVVAVSMPEDVKGEVISVRIYEVSGTKRALRR